ncbi:hypothetical protein BHM03_00033921 [Ensete ventricosum]|nr:hypothetical protein BHM03_00033921 [Ensete ventricosum]
MVVVLPRFDAASVTTPDHPRRLLFYHDKPTSCAACRASAVAEEYPGFFEVNDEKASVASGKHSCYRQGRNVNNAHHSGCVASE